MTNFSRYSQLYGALGNLAELVVDQVSIYFKDDDESCIDFVFNKGSTVSYSCNCGFEVRGITDEYADNNTYSSLDSIASIMDFVLRRTNGVEQERYGMFKPKNKNILPLDFNKIGWQVYGLLFRGHLQNRFEQILLKSIFKGKKLSYSAFEDSANQDEISFTTPTFSEAVIFARDNWQKHLESLYEIEPPFSQSPLVMAINAENYMGSLYKSKKGEGIIIAGPIELSDITVLFSTRTDILAVEAPKEYPEDNRNNFRRELTFGKEVFKEDLLERFHKNPDLVSKQLMDYSFLFNRGPTDQVESKQLIGSYIHALEAK